MVPNDAAQLGPLATLPGVWVGNGLTLVSLPDAEHGKPFRVQLNETREVLTFTLIDGPIADRGSKQQDVFFRGLRYLQQIQDRQTTELLHLETGLLLHMPATSSPQRDACVARLATIPHGDAVLATGPYHTTLGPPRIAEANAIPSGHAVSAAYVEAFLRSARPKEIPAEAVVDPNVVLRAAIRGAQIVETTTLELSTSGDGGIVNVPFVTLNARPTTVAARMWIENIRTAPGRETLQLQYSQRVDLEFDGIVWPHVSVATLTKRAPPPRGDS